MELGLVWGASVKGKAAGSRAVAWRMSNRGECATACLRANTCNFARTVIGWKGWGYLTENVRATTIGSVDCL